MKQIILITLMVICCLSIAGVVLYWMYLIHWIVAVVVAAIVGTGILSDYIE